MQPASVEKTYVKHGRFEAIVVKTFYDDEEAELKALNYLKSLVIEGDTHQEATR